MCRIEFIPLLLTEKADIFGIRLDNNTQTEYEKFYVLFKDCVDRYLQDDLERIVAEIRAFGEKGVLENKMRPEGHFNDRVNAMPIITIPRDKNKHGTLRLYCIRVSERLLILGGGGLKTVQSYEEDETLSKEVSLLERIDKELENLENTGVDLHEAIYNLVLNIE